MQNKSSFMSRLGAKGFTLIELLVVVLIIGILAAAALPQYQKAVEKSRAAEALQLMKTVNQAVDTYYLSSGEWPRTFDELAVDITWTGREKGYLNSNITDVRSNGIWSIQLENKSCQSIIATRLDGPYSGAGFLIEKNCPSIAPWENHELYCAEFLVGNKIFSGGDGRFCTQLLGAAFKGKTNALRAYTLPF